MPATGGGSGRANPLITITRLPPPNVEKRKSPVTGSKNAPSAPSSPLMNVRRDAITGSPFASTVYAATLSAWYSETSMLGPLNRGEPAFT